MSLTPGFRLGPYEVIAPLGAGGMGEVYRARDTRLGRDVAVKVLPEHLSSPEGRQRFEREAQAISQLSHPHICALHDVGNQDGTEYLVMEYLEGETLSARLVTGPLTLDKTLRYGIEIADALDRAHRQGIVHRDLKPANIMLTKSGVKLLDFGLAKLVAAPVPSGMTGVSMFPTSPSNLTGEGTILGTFQYLAPEQLEGKEADARTDIFGFGAVLYEMATGRKAFSGSSQASLISAIMSSQPPPIFQISPLAPVAFDRIVRVCLAKDPEDRWQSAHDIGSELKWIAEGSSAGGPPIAAPAAARPSGARLAWVAAAAATLAALAFALLLLARARDAPRMVQASISPPEKSSFAFEGGPMALSADGRRLAFLAPTPDRRILLWVRPLDGMAAQPLAGTDGARYPFWSPDGRFLAFFAGGKLKKIDASGGPPQILCDTQEGRGGSWSREGVILFSPSSRDAILRVSSAGGVPAAATALDASHKEFSHRFPFFLPDGLHFLYLAQAVGSAPGEGREICIGSLASKERRSLFRANSNVVFAPSAPGAATGHVLFVRERTLLAQPFDAKRLRLSGEAFPVGEQLQYFGNLALGVFAASDNGILAYQAGGATGLSQLVWLDRAGRQLEAVGPPGDYLRTRISPDGRRVAMDVRDAQTGQADIWIYDFSRRVSTRFTSVPGDNIFPVWSPDDSRIVFESNRKGSDDLYQKVSSGTGGDEEFLAQEGRLLIPTDWSSDGRFVLHNMIDARRKGGWDLGVYSVAEKKTSLFLATPANEANGRFSPDGRWVAYTSDESGRYEIYVQPFPVTGGKWQISTEGGGQPVWNRNGKELFYVSADNKLMAVDVKADSRFEGGSPRKLFDVTLKSGTGWKYDVSPDGQRFLANIAVGEVKANLITLVLNWAPHKE